MLTGETKQAVEEALAKLFTLAWGGQALVESAARNVDGACKRNGTR